MSQISLWDTLTLEDDYCTDTHCRQERLQPVVDRIGEQLDFSIDLSTLRKESIYPFYGVYYGQSALPLQPDTICYYTDDIIENVQVWNLEDDQMKLLQGFAWVVMICIVYAVAVYMVNESISTHYREVCHDLHHENRLHTKLYQQSTVDSTTGILNRNAYNNYVIEYKEGNCDSISCIYIDVNGLHEYNNTYGHQAGDKMLKTVAAELKECFAEHSHYRIGGDEFVIICENTAFKSILMQLNHFREQMKIHNIYIASGMEWRDENMNLADMIKKADAKMYRDKERFYKAFPNARECGMLYQNAVE